MGIKNELKVTILILGIASMLLGSIAYMTDRYKATTLNSMLFKAGIVFTVLLGILIFKKIFDIFIRNRYKLKISYKNMPEEFLTFYNEIDMKDNVALKEAKNKALKIWNIITSLIILIIMCLIYSLMKFNKTLQENALEFKGFFGVLLLIGIVIIIFKLYKVKKQRENEYRYLYKKEILDQIVKLIDITFNYIPIEKMVKKENFYFINDNITPNNDSNYSDSDLETKNYNFYNLKSKITDTDCNFNLEELELKYKEMFGGRIQYRRIIYSFNIFNGFFVTLNMKKNIKAFVRIKKNKMIFKNANMKINNNEFEKYFDVYAKGVSDVESILTESILKTLIEFYKKYKINYGLTLKNDKLYIRFEMGSLFEPKIYRKII